MANLYKLEEASPKEPYVVTLTEEELLVIAALTGNVLGSSKSCRGITDDIYESLFDRLLEVLSIEEEDELFTIVDKYEPDEPAKYL